MTVKRAAAILIALISLCSCGAREAVSGEKSAMLTDRRMTPAVPISSPVSETSPDTSAESSFPIGTGHEVPSFRDLSPLSTEYYMTPVEDYSFERDRDIEFIMIHFSSNVKAKPEDPYVVDDIKNIYLKGEVSTNYVIDREGKIYCFIPEYRCAWHAGVGKWKGDERLKNKMNLYSIGVELLAMGSEKEMLRYISAEQYRELPDELVGYTEAQYEALGALITDICGTYGLPRDRDHIIGHQEYATKKPDPGELFDWDRVIGAH